MSRIRELIQITKTRLGNGEADGSDAAAMLTLVEYYRLVIAETEFRYREDVQTLRDMLAKAEKTIDRLYSVDVHAPDASDPEPDEPSPKIGSGFDPARAHRTPPAVQPPPAIPS